MAEHPVSEFEEWREIPGHPGYDVSSLGRVRSVNRLVTYSNGVTRFHPGADLRPSMSRGYHLVSLSGISISVHRLVCPIFHGPRPSNNHQVAHWNGDRTDNRAANLRWATPKENKADEIRHGRQVIGVRHHRTKLSEGDVRLIRKLRAETGMFYYKIAERFGISDAQAWVIINGKSWKHIT
jgi:hypothetical protein